jgi:hypothetical protein
MQERKGQYENIEPGESVTSKPLMTNAITQDPLALHAVVSRVSSSSLAAATQRISFIINDVPVDIRAVDDEHMVVMLFGALLNALITHPNNTFSNWQG